MSVKNLVSDIKGRTQNEGVSEQGAEQYIWTQAGKVAIQA
jgi:hypothetical protein